jgi:2-polyprenyl-3-methyl-5-hydroxy-6-metoxy-1,4-benzoquinol methylase
MEVGKGVKIMNNTTYQQKLEEEAELWGRIAEEQASATPPDWRFLRALRQNVIMHGAGIEALLEHVRPGMNTLELGCNSGWLTLAMAQRGASAHGLDISETAIRLAQTYYATIQHEISGRATYQVADLNYVELPAEHYDIVAVKGTLHHLINMEQVIEQIHATLKFGGLLWVADSHGEEKGLAVFLASGLTFVLPTQVSYRDKLRGLLRFGVRAPGRVKASMQAEGLSPFEGAGREYDWLKLISRQFKVERQIASPAFTGYVSAQLNMSDRVAIPLLKMMRSVDEALVRLKIVQPTGLMLFARKVDS